jgi:hypothetical protein
MLGELSPHPKFTAMVIDPAQMEEFEKAGCKLPAAYVHLAIKTRMM